MGLGLLRRGDWRRASIVALVGGSLWSGLMMQVVLPNADGLWLSRRLAEAATRAGAAVPGGAPPVAVSGYGEPSLVFLLGTRTRLIGGAEAADHIVDNPGAIAAVSDDTAPEFLARMEARQRRVHRFDAVSGFDYVWGVWRNLTLYRLEPPQIGRAHV